MEIKCQLDATDEFLLQILLLAQHVSGTIMPIIRSSRVLYKWLLPVVFGALFFKLSVWCGAEGYVSGLRVAAINVPSAGTFFVEIAKYKTPIDPMAWRDTRSSVSQENLRRTKTT